MTLRRSRQNFSNFAFLLLIVIGLFALSGCETESPTPSTSQSKTEPASASANSNDDRQLNQQEIVDVPVAEPANSKASAATPSEQPPTDESQSTAAAPGDTEEQTIEIPGSWNRLGKNEIWIDFLNKEVIVAGTICLDMGPLEMFACPANTKEHESVISVNALSSEVHAALIALGAEPGSPCQWDPEYKPATGPIVDIRLTWFDEEENKAVEAAAPSMIRNSRTREPMTHQWVFGGSQIWEDPETGDKIYYGDAGEMVCLSNFSTATMDLTVESSQSNDGLLFEAFTENIPPIGTKVYMHLKPGERIEPESDTKKSENESDSDQGPVRDKGQD